MKFFKTKRKDDLNNAEKQENCASPCEELDDDPDDPPRKPFCISLLFSLLVGFCGALITLAFIAENMEMNAINAFMVYLGKVIVIFAPVCALLGLAIKKSSFALAATFLYIAAGIYFDASVTWGIYGFAALLSLLGYTNLYDWEENFD